MRTILPTFIMCSMLVFSSEWQGIFARTESCGNGERQERGDSYEALRSGFTFRTEVTTAEEDGSEIFKNVITYATDAKGHVVKLVSEAMPLDTESWSKESFGEIVEEDVNFDGIPDLLVGTGPMNMFGNYTYDVFLWNNMKHCFEQIEDLPPLFDPSFDAEKKEIVSTFRLDDEVNISHYKWQNGKLVEISTETVSYSEMTED